MSLNLRIILLFCAFAINSVHGERILFVLPLATRSETHLFVPLAKELALKGHNVTFLSPVSSGFKSKNFREIMSTIPPLNTGDFDKSANILEGRRHSKNPILYFLSFDLSFIFEGSRKVYENEEFQKLLEEPFDLLILNGDFNSCFDGLIHKFQAPFIMLSSMPAFGYLEDLTGFGGPPSFVPYSLLEFTDKMNFRERFVNTLVRWTFTYLNNYVIAAESEKVYRQYLGQDYPPMMEIERNVSLVFSNSHFAVTTPRPFLPDVIEIGGIHCREAQQLPEELDDFLSGAKDGFIFFSLGTVTTGVSLPEETRKLFRNVFSRLKQRVLWKWESEQMFDLPSNVKLGKWLPQQDILGHKNIKLFITHGGLLSTQEAAYHGVPVIGLPLFVDQDANMKQAESKGMSINLEILDLTEEILENSINKILTDPSYTQNAKKVSSMFKNQPIHPLQKAVFWTEFVLKHKGSAHLRSASRDLNWVQYHSYDVIATIFGAIFFILIVFVKLFKCIFCKSKKNGPAMLNYDNGNKKYK